MPHGSTPKAPRWNYSLYSLIYGNATPRDPPIILSIYLLSLSGQNASVIRGQHTCFGTSGETGFGGHGSAVPEQLTGTDKTHLEPGGSGLIDDETGKKAAKLPAFGHRKDSTVA
jgi:hypothetical protein